MRPSRPQNIRGAFAAERAFWDRFDGVLDVPYQSLIKVWLQQKLEDA
jgi:hypothetical protein